MKEKHLYAWIGAYLMLPLLIFSVGYLRWYVAVLCVAYMLYAASRVYHRIAASVSGESSLLENRRRVQAGLLLIAILVSFLQGVGGYWPQSSDWIAKNPILNELVESAWPVVLHPGTWAEPLQAIAGTEDVALVYYFFYYLPAACVGKLCGISVARAALLVWTALGLYLLLNVLLRLIPSKYMTRQAVWLSVCVFVAFGGCDIVGHLVRLGIQWIQGDGPLAFRWCIDVWGRPYFWYASNWSSLYWCFNQCIPVWLIASVLVLRFDLRTMAFIGSLSLLYSPWAVIGLVALLAYVAVRELFKDKQAWRRLLSMENVLFPLMMLLLVGTFYMSNHRPLDGKGWMWDFLSSPMEFVVKYVLFIMVEIGVYGYFLRKEIRGNVMLQASFLVLLLIPFYKMTICSDLMRASLPALFIINIYWMRWCLAQWKRRKLLVCMVMVVTSLSAVQWTLSSLKVMLKTGTPVTFWEDESYSHTDLEDVIHLGECQFFAHDYSETFFWKYLGKE
ncbi:MAG: hypothetical protein ACI36X_05295 [Bacteroidaceae bacterium]